MSAKFDKPNAFQLKEGATAGSGNAADYEPVAGLSSAVMGRDHEDCVPFPPLKVSGVIRFQGSGNEGVFVFRVGFKSDDQDWVFAPLRVFSGGGLTYHDAVALPVGTVAVSVVRMDSGTGAVGYVIDAEV